MPKMKPGRDQGNAALPKLGSPWISKHSQNLLKYNAVDDHAAHPMSMRGPLDKGHPMKKYDDPMKKYGPLSSHGIGGSHPTTVDEFGTPIPKGFKADAKGVTGTVRPMSSTQGADTSASTRRERSQLVEGGLSEGEDFATSSFFTAEKIRQASQPITTRENLSDKQKKAVMQSRSYSGKKSPKDVAKILNIKPTITTVKVDK